MRGPAFWCGLAGLVLALSTGCATGKMERSFGIEHPARPADWPVEVTVDEKVSESLFEAIGADFTSPPPPGSVVGWASGEAFTVAGALEALKHRARELGGDGVHVESGVMSLAARVSGLVYRK